MCFVLDVCEFFRPQIRDRKSHIGIIARAAAAVSFVHADSDYSVIQRKALVAIFSRVIENLSDVSYSDANFPDPLREEVVARYVLKDLFFGRKCR